MDKRKRKVVYTLAAAAVLALVTGASLYALAPSQPAPNASPPVQNRPRRVVRPVWRERDGRRFEQWHTPGRGACMFVAMYASMQGIDPNTDAAVAGAVDVRRRLTARLRERYATDRVFRGIMDSTLNTDEDPEVLRRLRRAFPARFPEGAQPSRAVISAAHLDYLSSPTGEGDDWIFVVFQDVFARSITSYRAGEDGMLTHPVSNGDQSADTVYLLNIGSTIRGTWHGQHYELLRLLPGRT